MFPRSEGAAIDDRYALGPAIGSGGLGRVYRAHDQRLGRDVAMKFLRGSRATSATLEREARVLARLQHPNIVAVFDVGSSEGELYLTMELIEGQSLAQWLRKTSRPWAEVVALFRQAGEGLAAAHAGGVVHRDFKPANVMLDVQGRVRVVDFGLARDADPIADRVRADEPGQAAGTLPYMAPEQFRGHVTPASDQFGFCTSLYEALCGDRPWKTPERGIENAAEAADLRRAMRRDSAPRWVIDVVLTGLQRDPDRRFAGMATLLDALRPNRKRWWLGGGTMVLSAIALGSALRSDPCQARGKQADALWTDADAAAFASAAPSETGPKVDETLSQYALRWNASDANACRSHVDGTLSTQLHDARQRCLAQSLSKVRYLVSQFAAPSPATIANAVRTTALATQLQQCEDDESLLSNQPDPGSDAALAVQLLEAIDRAHIARWLGDQAGALELLQRTHDELESPSAALREQLWLASHLGTALVQHGEHARAEALVLPALLLAEQHPNWARVNGDLQVVLAQAIITDATRANEALLLARQGAATLSSLGDHDQVQVAALAMTAQAARLTGDFDEALRASSRGLRVAERAAQDQALAWFDLPLNHAELLGVRGDILAAQGQLDQAASAYSEALDRLAANALDISLTATLCNNLGVVQRKRGHVDEAIAAFERAATIRLRLGNLEGAALTVMNVGNAYAATSRTHAAVTAYTRALSHLPNDASVSRAKITFARGLARQTLQQWDSARTDHEAARASVIASQGERASQLYDIDIGLGQTLVELHDWDAARLVLQHGRTLETPTSSAYGRAELRIALSRAWTHGDPIQAKTLAQAALRDARASGDATLLAQAAALLTTRQSTAHRR